MTNQETQPAVITKEQLKPFLFTGTKVKLVFKEGSDMPWYYDTEDFVELSGLILDWYGVDIIKITPALYPMSMIYKEILHNGKKITPILELAKICKPNIQWFLSSDLSVREFGEERFRFSYRPMINSFVLSYSGLISRPEVVPNQSLMFQKLAEFQFNFTNIPQDLYVNKLNIK